MMNLLSAFFLLTNILSINEEAYVLFEKASEVPLSLATEVYTVSEYHEVDPYEVIALLLAENKSLKFNNNKIGDNGEIGLFQLDPGTWVPYANKICEEKECFSITKKITKKDLFDKKINIEVAVLAIRYMKESHADHGKTSCPDWRAHYRCAKNSRNTKSCKNSVKYVQRIEAKLRGSDE
jgi:hypothetical protein